MKHVLRARNISLASLFVLSQTCLAVTAEISFGELIDKITILTIKSQRITNPDKLKNIYKELRSLKKTYNTSIGNHNAIPTLQALLQEINEKLWDIEDAIRIEERAEEFGDKFIALARSVYLTNDQRFEIKKQIDLVLGSAITEEKSYARYDN